MKLSDSERQLLLAVGRARRRQAASDRQSLEEIAEAEMGTLLDWDDAFVGLTEKGLMFQSGENYLLTKEGEARGEREQEVHLP